MFHYFDGIWSLLYFADERIMMFDLPVKWTRILIIVLLLVITVLCITTGVESQKYKQLDRIERQYDANGYLIVIDEETGRAGLYYSQTPLVYFTLDVVDADVTEIPVAVYSKGAKDGNAIRGVR